MKKQVLLLISLFILSGISFSQENRSKRGWNDANQTTYYMTQEGVDSEKYPNSQVNNPANNDWNSDLTHRSKNIWADASSISTDEKTGMHSYIPYPYVGEDDVIWVKRLTKLIDIAIPQNHSLAFPQATTYASPLSDSKMGAPESFYEVLNGVDARKNFFQILKDAATTINPETGEPLVSVYNESLTRKLTKEEVIGDMANAFAGVFHRKEVKIQRDDYGEIIEEKDTISHIEPFDIVGYYIEEEVFFDKRRSILDNRFISITPLVVAEGDEYEGMYTGAALTVRPLATFYFPEIRQLLANHKVFPLDGNMANRMSFDEFFHRKLFASNLVKETNVYDRRISQYLPGRTLDQLLEGDKIREQIRRYESDMWNY